MVEGQGDVEVVNSQCNMSSKTEKKLSTDINANFDDEISLYNIVGRKNTVQKLRIIREGIFNSISNGQIPQLEPILFVGKSASTYARAYSNSIGNLEFHEAYGSMIYNGGASFDNFLTQGGDSSTYYLRDIDKLIPYCINLLYKLLKYKILHISSFYDKSLEKNIPFNSLLLLSAQEEDKINPAIRNNINIVCKLEEYTQQDIYNILIQRVKFLGWGVDWKYKVIEHIATISMEDVIFALNLLSWTIRCALSEGRDILTEKDLNKALHILQ